MNRLFQRISLLLAVVLLLGWAADLHAQVVGSITLRDGSMIHGEIVDMAGGTLRLRAAFGAGDPFEIKWEEVTHFATGEEVTLVLTDGTKIKGLAQRGDPGLLELKAEPVSIPIPIELSSITAINPPKRKPIKFRANVNLGGKITSGNTDDKQVNFISKFRASSKRLRLGIELRWFYAEEDGTITDRNAFGTQKLDVFFTEEGRWYGYLGSLFEQDTFDDLDLRSTVTTGPGYQVFREGDFENPYLKQLELAVDAGFGFFSENRKVGEDDTHAVMRWGVDFSWPLKEGIRIFHVQQGFPNLEDLNDFYINSSQGIEFSVWKGFVTTITAIYKYDNDPPPSTDKDDLTALLTLGWDVDW